MLLYFMPEQVHDLVSWLSPQPFYKVQERLIKRSRCMAKRQACIAGRAGYIRSAVALAGDELFSVPGQEPVPDLMASLEWFFGQMQRYDKQRGRAHVEEIWKKRLAYGFVMAQQMDEEYKQYGIDLHEEDWAALDDHLARLSGKSKKRTRWQATDNGAA